MSGYSGISLWLDQCAPLHPGAPLPGDRDYDVAIVGGGYTGLWTAWYLKQRRPGLSVCLLEAHLCGFGASGRNGGWLMASLQGLDKLLRGLPGTRRERLLESIRGILPEVEEVLAGTGIDCDFRRGGGLYTAARYPEQERIQRDELAELWACGFTGEDYRWLEADEMAARLAMAATRGGIYTPHVARIHPGKLVRGLSRAVHAAGVDLFEQTRVLGLDDAALVTDRGRVRAPVRIIALEGFSYELIHLRRQVLPVQSRMVATEPLPEDRWRQIGLARDEVFCDGSPLITYGQRSADDRLVFGARGLYRFGGRPRSDFSADRAAFDRIESLLLACFPQLRDAVVSHRWGGTLGIPRSRTPHAVFDPVSGLGTAGGYLGEGVGASNLMARSLVDLVLGEESELAAMPWCHRAHPDSALRRWEPEPLRWLGYSVINLAQQWEERCYRGDAPGWQRSLARRGGALAGRLLG